MTLTQHRVLQYCFILLVLGLFGGAYWYFQTRAATNAKSGAERGLVGYWSFNEGNGTVATDASGAGNTGTLNGMEAADWIDGKFGKALAFDGASEYVNVPDADSIDFDYNVDFSYSVWVKIPSTQADTGSDDNSILEKGSASSRISYGLRIINQTGGSNAGKLRALRYDGTNVAQIVPSTLYNDDRWHHVVMTKNGSGLTLYVDNVSVGTLTDNTTTTTTSAEALRIGSVPSANLDFQGTIDEVRVYNRFLTTAEIATLYTTGQAKLNASQTTINNNGLIGMWSFDGRDISGTTATDRSGSGNNGTLTNGPVQKIGKVGQALNFDGSNDYVTMGSPASLDNITNLSVCAWIYPETTTAFATIVSKADGGGWQFEMLDSSGDNRLAFFVYFTGFDGEWLAPVGAVPNNTWSHVCVVYNNSSNTNDPVFYVNGASVAVTENIGPTGSANSDATADLMVGEIDTGASEYFDGSIDEVRIYNRLITATEAQSLYLFGAGNRMNSSSSQLQGTGRLDSGLTGYWALEENTGTSAGDSTSNANNGTLTNGPTWTTGQNGTAVDFDGNNDYITVADPAGGELDVADGTPFSVAGWFYRDAAGTNDIILSKGTNATAGYAVGFFSGTNTYLTFRVTDGTDTYGYYTAPTTYTATGWNHFTAVWGDTYMKLYVNGVDMGVYAEGTIGNINSLANSSAFVIGARSDATDPFDGKVDDVRFYRRALSADEARQLYLLTTPTGVDTSLKGYWSFNGQDISGTTAFDRSGINNNGTLTGSPTLTRGRIGQALDFDGSDDTVNAGSGAQLDNVALLTICAWINPDSDIDLANDPRIYTKTDASGLSGPGLELNLITSNPRLVFRRGYVSEMGRWAASSTVFPLAVWSHVCVTHDSTSVSNDPLMYLNGSSIPVDFEIQTPNGALSDDSSYNAHIGNRSDQARAFKGLMDEVRVYNRILSATEVGALYNQGR